MTLVKYKYFTENYSNIVENINTLRKKFPGCEFKNGKYNGKYGTYIISSGDKGINEYDKPIKSKIEKDLLFFPPLAPISDKQKFLDSFEISKSVIKAEVELASGVKIKIIPATAEPRKIALSLFEDAEEEVGFVSPYGKMAFDIDDKLASEKEVSLLEGLKLFVLALEKSYSINLDLFNWLEIVSTEDIENLTYACLGYTLEEDKKKEE